MVGDPLSPFLFNMVVESLSCYLKKAFELNLLKEASLGNDEVHISHLQFADDTILFLELNMEYLVNRKRILRCFEMASGFKINFHKSCVVKVGKNWLRRRIGQPLLNCLHWEWTVPTTASHFAKALSSLFSVGSTTVNVIRKGLKVVVGRGTRASLWKDAWNGTLSLMVAYLRMFALAVKKEGTIDEFGRWREEEWDWEVQFRRRIFDWEVDQWVAWWFKYHGSGSTKPITIMMENLEKVCIDVKPPKSSTVEAWSLPQNDALKFNVDGATNGEWCRAGIGGALRNSNGEVLCSFSAYVGAQDAISAEFLAFHKACRLCVDRGVFTGRKIEVVSDSRKAVSWVNEEGYDNLQHLNLIYDIRVMLVSLGNASVIFNPRNSHSMADALAKKGLWLSKDSVEWGVPFCFVFVLFLLICACW
ncbi:hypothetical protein Dsin_014843 [Dipteronia sinensis]|uniref:Reverse transcriptase domain-containing protein n=1 Tax=Dipteronia sinensis TaxID=43782 RepID=A0AAE0AMQ6_9ROSI|nr:hypothetical protein Dsin_014843 [Dipteronia sinensis]